MSAHHPTEEYLVHYAAGALPQGQAILVAAHLTYCPTCRAAVRDAEAVGGALLAEDMAGAGAIPSDFPFDYGPDHGSSEISVTDTDVPAPLRPFIGPRLSGINWRTFWPGMQTSNLRLKDDPAKVSLLRLKPGVGMPIHHHGGDELTLVLHGSYTDETGRYRVGDVATGEPSLTHQPVADADSHCICLTVIDAPLIFKGVLAKIAARILPF